MLRLSSTDGDITSRVEKRRHLTPSIVVERDEDFILLAKEQGHEYVRIKLRYEQLISGDNWSFEPIEQLGSTCVRLVNNEGQVCGIATTGIRLNDYVVSLNGSCIVLRQVSVASRYCTIIGKLTDCPRLFRGSFGNRCRLWCGVEDIIIHMTQDKAVFQDWEMPDEPSKKLFAALDLPFCEAPYSSFGELLPI
jgi:hypothetical protein